MGASDIVGIIGVIVAFFGVVVGTLGVIAAFFGAGVGYWFGRRSEFAAAEWMREIRSWASGVIKVLSEAIYDTKATESEALEQAAKLSALIDIGRFYLPNQPANHGMENPPAYRGYRHAALDPLVVAFNVINGDTTYTVPEAKILYELRREFVSALFRILGPEHHNKEIAKIIRTSYKDRINDLTGGGLIDGKSIPPGEEAVLTNVIKRIEDNSSNKKNEQKHQ